MGAELGPDVELGEPNDRSVPPNISQIIRDEVRSALRSELNHEERAEPPAYDSSAPLLSEGDGEEEADGALLGEDGDKKEEAVRGPGFYLRPCLALFPVVASVLSIPVLMLSGLDELALSFLTYLALMAAYFILFILFGIMGVVESTLPVRWHPTKENEHLPVLAVCTWHFWCCQLVFALMAYGWLNSSHASVFGAWRVAARFDAQFGRTDMTGSLVRCLDQVGDLGVNRADGRNASIADVVECLVFMGVNATGFIKGVN